MQDKVNSLTAEKGYQKTCIRDLENELRRQKSLYEVERAKANESETHLYRRSSRDSGFGSVEDSDEALERQKASHAKDRMSSSTIKVADNRI